MSLKPPWEFTNPLCSELGPALFFLEDDGIEYSKKDIDKIKALCNTCEHVIDCAEWGISKERFGIWGGLNNKERALIKRKRLRGRKNEISSIYRE